MGLRMADLFTPKCTADELISIICASPPGTSVHHVFADLLVSEMAPRRQKPPTRFNDRDNSTIALDVMPLPELMKRLGG